jgi:hypothetical protein
VKRSSIQGENEHKTGEKFDGVQEKVQYCCPHRAMGCDSGKSRNSSCGGSNPLSALAFTHFLGSHGGKSRGIVDLIAIRKDH